MGGVGWGVRNTPTFPIFPGAPTFLGAKKFPLAPKEYFLANCYGASTIPPNSGFEDFRSALPGVPALLPPALGTSYFLYIYIYFIIFCMYMCIYLFLVLFYSICIFLILFYSVYVSYFILFCIYIIYFAYILFYSDCLFLFLLFSLFSICGGLLRRHTLGPGGRVEGRLGHRAAGNHLCPARLPPGRPFCPDIRRFDLWGSTIGVHPPLIPDFHFAHGGETTVQCVGTGHLQSSPCLR